MLHITTAGILALTATAAVPASAAVAGKVAGVSALRTIACPASTTCVATGQDSNFDGKGVVITAATGAAKVWSGHITAVPNDVACPPAASQCLFVAVGVVGTLAISSGALKITATPPPPKGGIVALDALSCPKTCYAVGFEGTHASTTAVLLHLSAAGKVVSTTDDTGSGSGAIACPSASVCLMSDYVSPRTSIQVVTNGHIGASHPLPSGHYAESMSCYGTKACYLLGGSSSDSRTDEIFPVNPATGAVGTAVTIGGFSGSSYPGAINCISASTCLVSGFTGSGSTVAAAVVTVSNGTPGHPVTYPGDNLDAAACAAATECYGVGLGSAGAIIDKLRSGG